MVCYIFEVGVEELPFAENKAVEKILSERDDSCVSLSAAGKILSGDSVCTGIEVVIVCCFACGSEAVNKTDCKLTNVEEEIRNKGVHDAEAEIALNILLEYGSVD